MVLGVSEDFTSEVQLDLELTTIPSSGLYINSGVHPSITIDNLLNFLPNLEFTFSDWDNSVTYDKFEESRSRKDIVMLDDVMYQSISASNSNNSPDEENSLYWIETNIESLRLKTFLYQVKDKVYSDLGLEKRLITNQYLYKDGDKPTQLPNDYAAWVLEPKGSDYVAIKINEISLQKDGTTPVNLYVINQNQLLETITLTPDNGSVSFNKVDVVLKGKGKFYLAIDSTDVYTGNVTVDPLKFDGLVAYTAIGTGDSPEGAKYIYNTFDNGIGINVSAYLDAKEYIDNNISEFGSVIRTTFEYMALSVFFQNSNNRSNRSQRIQMSNEMLMAELKDLTHDTVVKRYYSEKKEAKKVIEKTFDTQLSKKGGYDVKIGSI